MEGRSADKEEIYNPGHGSESSPLLTSVSPHSFVGLPSAFRGGFGGFIARREGGRRKDGIGRKQKLRRQEERSAEAKEEEEEEERRRATPSLGSANECMAAGGGSSAGSCPRNRRGLAGCSN